jgi:murein DD-endopeptidase MepM/ murein hydrolase activator NlpD
VALIWPVQGEVSRGFEQDTTRRHDGVDIVAPRGTSVQAAADGEVIFSGWGPGGYGRIVILQHQAEVVTIYAHNHANLVRLGERVRQGEPIATVGQSGRATGNHLHFEVRYKAIPISPHKFLPSRPSNVAVLDHSSRSRTTP